MIDRKKTSIIKVTFHDWQPPLRYEQPAEAQEVVVSILNAEKLFALNYAGLFCLGL